MKAKNQHNTTRKQAFYNSKKQKQNKNYYSNKKNERKKEGKKEGEKSSK